MKKKTVRQKSRAVLRGLVKARAAKAKKAKAKAVAVDCDAMKGLDRARCLARHQGLAYADIRKLLGGDLPGLERAVTVGAAQGRRDYLESLAQARRRGSLSALKISFERFVASKLAVVDDRFAGRYLERVNALIQKHAPEHVRKPAEPTPRTPRLRPRRPTVPAEAIELARLGVSVEDIQLLTGHALEPADLERYYIDLRREVARQVIAEVPKGRHSVLTTFAKAYLRSTDTDTAAPAPGWRVLVERTIAKIYDADHAHVRRNLEVFRGLEPGSLERWAK